MDQKQDKTLFPGQKKGLIKMFIKRIEQEKSTQLRFYLFGDEPEDDY